MTHSFLTAILRKTTLAVMEGDTSSEGWRRWICTRTCSLRFPPGSGDYKY